jgi:hypothetical protein
MDLMEAEWEGVHWILVAQDMDWWLALMNTVMRHFKFHDRQRIS